LLTTFIVSIPDGTADEVVHDLTTREAQRADQLAQQGNLVRLWALPAEPGTSPALELWRAKPVRTARDPDIAAIGPANDHPNDPRDRRQLTRFHLPAQARLGGLRRSG
jgi:muconolactone delta-isomerase